MEGTSLSQNIMDPISRGRLYSLSKTVFPFSQFTLSFDLIKGWYLYVDLIGVSMFWHEKPRVERNDVVKVHSHLNTHSFGMTF